MRPRSRRRDGYVAARCRSRESRARAHHPRVDADAFFMSVSSASHQTSDHADAAHLSGSRESHPVADALRRSLASRHREIPLPSRALAPGGRRIPSADCVSKRRAAPHRTAPLGKSAGGRPRHSSATGRRDAAVAAATTDERKTAATGVAGGQVGINKK